MNTHIINIGDELLIGQVVNTNASWMAEELNKRNIAVTNISVVADNADAIRSQLDRSLTEADVVLITGGLGPTKDDITKTVLCRYFNDTLITHIPTLENVRNYFTRRGFEFTPLNQAQALVPSNCTVILNKVGTAPCMVFEHDKKLIISMPGVPFEMKWLMTEGVLPLLEQRLGTEAIFHKTILTFGIGESFLADRIERWENALPPHIHLAYLPEAGKVRLRLSAYGADHTRLEKEVAEQIELLLPMIDENVYGYDDDTVSTVIGRMMTNNNATIGTAESCTGGLVAHKIVEPAGASAYFIGSVVAYDNRIKEQQLGVSHDTLVKYGAVSEQTAIEMAEGCRSRLQVDYAIATTGISGPTGGTEEKPRGTVYIAIATPDNVTCHRYNFETTRLQHQERTANQALFDLWQILKKQ